MKRIFALLIMFTLYFEAQASSHVFQIASYNIKGLPFPIQPVHTPRYKKMVREIRAMHKEGKAPDVILVQEAFSVFTKYLYSNLRDIYPYRVRGPGNRIKWNSGLEILSRYPITNARTITFGSCDGFDCLSRKGVLFTRIKLPGSLGEVDLYNTHMQADNPGRDARISQAVRSHQTETLIGLVNRTHKEGIPSFIGGDLNTRPQDENFERLLEEFGDIDTRVFCQTSNSCTGFNAMPATYWNRKIDHILYTTGDLRVTPLDYEQFFNGKDYSDHDLIKGTYKLERD